MVPKEQLHSRYNKVFGLLFQFVIFEVVALIMLQMDQNICYNRIIRYSVILGVHYSIISLIIRITV